jgi:cytochrome c556
MTGAKPKFNGKARLVKQIMQDLRASLKQLPRRYERGQHLDDVTRAGNKLWMNKN